MHCAYDEVFRFFLIPSSHLHESYIMYTRTLKLTQTLRRELKEPLGSLIEGTPKETVKRLEELIQKEKPACIISVGDIVSQNLANQGISAKVVVVDNRVMREDIEPIQVNVEKTDYIKNPAGTITPRVWTSIGEALKREGRTKIVVEGEEDLLTLVAVLQAPENSLVVYGQPHKGIVVIKVNSETRRYVRRIVKAMSAMSKS